MDMACKTSKEVSVIEILVSLVSLTLYCRTFRFRCKLQNFPIALCLSLVYMPNAPLFLVSLF
jgi:hypothetical protein